MIVFAICFSDKYKDFFQTLCGLEKNFYPSLELFFIILVIRCLKNNKNPNFRPKGRLSQSFCPDFGQENRKNASKKANMEAPAWVSKVSSGNIERSMMTRNTVYK